MSAFDRALRFTLSWEGGYSRTPGDKGGETYCGISRVMHPDWEGWHALEATKQLPTLVQHDLLMTDVEDFYRTEFWEPLRCDDMPERLALVMFDGAVNCGCTRAAKWLQSTLMVGADGKIGPRTLEAVHDHDMRGEGDYLVGEVLDAREAHYTLLIAKDATQEKFRKGWFNRTAALRKEVA